LYRFALSFYIKLIRRRRTLNPNSKIQNPKYWLNRFFDTPMNVGRNAAKINGFHAGNKTFAGRAVLLRLSTTTPKHFHSMRGAAFRTDTFDCKAICMFVADSVNTIMLFP
jgi:hypothetical protein